MDSCFENIKIDYDKGYLFRVGANGILKRTGISKAYFGQLKFTEERRVFHVDKFIYENYHKVKLHDADYLIHMNGDIADNRIVNLLLQSRLIEPDFKYVICFD